jgi:excisionase family DNA binding protein
MMSKIADDVDAAVMLPLPPVLLEAVAQRAAALVLEQLRLEQIERTPNPAPYLTVAQAAVYLGCRSRQRVDDLLSSRRLTRFKDGRRTLVSRAELDTYLAR